MIEAHHLTKTFKDKKHGVITAVEKVSFTCRPGQIYGLLGAFLAPAFGAMADRWGVRRVALGSLTAFGLVFASFSLMPASLFWFYAIWTLIGLVGMLLDLMFAQLQKKVTYAE